MRPGQGLVAVGQIGAVADSKQNVASTIRAAEAAAGNGARLIVFPECGLTGYGHDSLEECLDIAMLGDGNELNELADCARELGAAIVVGYLEREGDRVYNTATLLAADGTRGDYRKTHLPYLAADRFVTPGKQGPVVVQTDVGRVGLSICYDLRFPEWSRCLALTGAEVIANPTNWAETARPWARLLPPARAFENGVYVLAANRGDREGDVDYIGLSSICDPGGDVLELADRGEQLLYAEVNLSRVRPRRWVGTPGEGEYLDGRRPELYDAIVTPQQG